MGLQKDDVVLKEIEGHIYKVEAVAVSKDGRMIASGDVNGELIAWHGERPHANLSPKPSKSTLAKSAHWTFLSMVQCW